jgi:hypothetical protein
MKWMIGGPEIARLVKDFNRKEEESEAEKRHHEDTDENKFRKDVQGLVV